MLAVSNVNVHHPLITVSDLHEASKQSRMDSKANIVHGKAQLFPKMFLRSMECVKSLPEILLMCERLYRAVSPVGMGCMGNTSACGVCSPLFCVDVTMPHKPEMELHDSGYKSYYVGSSGSALLRCRLTAVSTRQPVWCCSASQGKHR